MIFVTVKYNQLKDVTAALSENHSKNICFIGNNVNCSFMEETLPSKNIFFAYSFCSGYRDENIVYSLDFKRIIIGKMNSGSLNQELIKQIFKNTGYRIFFEPDIESWLLCRAAFLIPLALACYHCNGKLLKIRWDTVYQNKILDAIIEGYRSIKKSGHKIIPQKKSRFETPLWRFKKLLQFRSMFGFKLSRILISDYAMNSRAEFSALDKDFKDFMNRNCASCDVWKHLEIE